MVLLHKIIPLILIAEEKIVFGTKFFVKTVLTWNWKCFKFGCQQAPAAVWPDWAICWTLGNFSKPLATTNLPKSLTFLSNFLKVSKTLIFLMKSFLVNFYRHLATFYWSRWPAVRVSLTCNSHKKQSAVIFLLVSF